MFHEMPVSMDGCILFISEKYRIFNNPDVYIGNILFSLKHLYRGSKEMIE